MRKLYLIIILFSAVLFSCKPSKKEIIDSKENEMNIVSDSSKNGVEVFSTKESDKLHDSKLLNDTLKENSKVIFYEKNGIIGVIFTQAYFKDNPNNKTPTENQIDEIEKLIKDDRGDFASYYRQYYRHMGRDFDFIHIQLIPMTPKEKYHQEQYKKWRKHLINVKDDINIRYLQYDVKHGKLTVMPKSNWGG